MAASVKLIENSARNHEKLTLEQLSVSWEKPLNWYGTGSACEEHLCAGMPEPLSHPWGAHPAVSAHPPLSWSAEHTAANGASIPNNQCTTTQWGRKHVLEVMPSKRVMGLNWCPRCWGWELSFCPVQWYCSSWTTCLHSPLSQSCPYTTHPSSSGLPSRPFRGCSCAG